MLTDARLDQITEIGNELIPIIPFCTDFELVMDDPLCLRRYHGDKVVLCYSFRLPSDTKAFRTRRYVRIEELATAYDLRSIMLLWAESSWHGFARHLWHRFSGEETGQSWKIDWGQRELQPMA